MTNRAGRIRQAVAVMVVSAMLSSTFVLCDEATKKAATEELPPWLAQKNGTKTVGDIVGDVAADKEEETKSSAAKLPGWKKDRMEKAALFKETPADVVIAAVLAEPMGRQKEFIQLKNLGGQTQDLEGWKLTLKNGGENEETFTFTASADCPTKIAPRDALLVLKKDAANPCGFSFDLGPSEELILFEAGEDAEGIDSMTWGNLGRGLVLYRSSDNEYEKAPQDVDGNIIDVLRRLGGFNNLITFLEYFDLDKILDGKGIRATNEWHNKIVREMDTDIPYTLFAIKDEHWDKTFQEMAGEWAPPLTATELLEIDDALVFDIISFLMVQEAWNSRSLRLKMRDSSSMAFQTAHPERKAVLQLDDSGTILLNYDCVDSPSPDEFGCGIQKGWGKCQEDWMNDNGFFSGRPLGYCEYECDKCYCDPMDGNCAQAIVSDVTASSGTKGVVHVIDRLIEAPPILKKPEPVDGETTTKKPTKKKAPKKEDKKKESSSSSGSSGGGSSRRTYGYNPWW
eukprot:CAMPEP_0197471042 /NCGR_PEP_ID=MMETSP1309-20131121/1871_1 /TAXON_ID=464262 /ORGANISM="Genus nov. species nov., Strain RCC998" /LENGTH=510 /DNA_ID=CAMNT_0043008407 /DNA_START=410 /DNA_END=1939 /DNA_ORIENTATION=-